MTDSYIMFRRNLTKTLRSPEAVIMAVVVPVIMMVLFGIIFGGVAEIEGFSYINFIVPGIILQCICNSSTATAISVHNDMTKGLIDRFRSMRISKSAFISGHVWMSVIRSIVITAATIAAAFAIGFRPEAGLIDWLIAIGILLLFIVAVTWIIVIVGLIANDAEAASGASFLLVVFTFASSGFAPVETMPAVLRVFAENQPMTAVIDAVRNLVMGVRDSSEIITALVWCAGITIAAFVLARRIYKSKLTK